jgi:hypothetical protein
MLLLESNDHWWKYFKDHDLYFTTEVSDYKGNSITSDYYRKTFTNNHLANVYTGCFYFKKVNTAYEFFKWLEIIVTNWQKFYKIHLKNNMQKFCSIDVSAALALKFMDFKTDKSSIPSFTHMKTELQGWKHPPDKWSNVLCNSMDKDLNLKIGNFQQAKLFHYVEPEFLTDTNLGLLKAKYNETR